MQELVKLRKELRDRFERWWAEYPNKKGKGAAERTWAKLRPTEADLQMLLRKLEEQKHSEKWQEDGGAYIPHGSTYLNQKRWEDQPVEISNPKRTATQIVDDWMETNREKTEQFHADSGDGFVEKLAEIRSKRADEA